MAPGLFLDRRRDAGAGRRRRPAHRDPGARQRGSARSRLRARSAQVPCAAPNAAIGTIPRRNLLRLRRPLCRTAPDRRRTRRSSRSLRSRRGIRSGGTVVGVHATEGRKCPAGRSVLRQHGRAPGLAGLRLPQGRSLTPRPASRWTSTSRSATTPRAITGPGSITPPSCRPGRAR